jgi:hypothetical protein
MLRNLATDCVYKAVAWQRVEEIRYNVMKSDYRLL